MEDPSKYDEAKRRLKAKVGRGFKSTRQLERELELGAERNEKREEAELRGAEQHEMRELAYQFADIVLARNWVGDLENALKDGTAAQWIRDNMGGAPGLKSGAIVEKAGAQSVRKRAAEEYGEDARYLENLELRLTNRAGALDPGIPLEIDGVILNGGGRLASLVSAKTRPGAADPTRDRTMVASVYAMPEDFKNPKHARDGIKNALPSGAHNALPQVATFKTMQYTGIMIQYTEGGAGKSEPLNAFRAEHPLAVAADALPVLALTPQRAGRGQGRGAGIELLSGTTDEVMAQFGRMVLDRCRKLG